jgi:predicted O-methyltransferase YrrM
MVEHFKRIAKQLPFLKRNRIAISWVKRNGSSWLAQQLPAGFIVPSVHPYSERIEKIAQETNRLGPQPVWLGYAQHHLDPTRLPDIVRTDQKMGNLFTLLVRSKNPEVIVEFGTAFGVSGMYWLAGLESNKKGTLFTFEPNRVWAKIADKNLSQISSKYTLIEGTFEENVDHYLDSNRRIDIAFIDAVHTPEFVIPQLDLVVAKSNPGALILIDDIYFSDDMKKCWEEVATDSKFISSAALDERVGILEL